MASLISCAVLEPFSTTAAYMVAIYQEKAVLKSSDSKAEDSRDGAPQHSRSDVVRSAAINNGFGASLEDLVCLWDTETFRPWSNHAGTFNRQQPFRRGAPSRLLVTSSSYRHLIMTLSHDMSYVFCLPVTHITLRSDQRAVSLCRRFVQIWKFFPGGVYK